MPLRLRRVTRSPARDLREALHGRHGRPVRTDLFFHPYDIVPAAEFISALFEIGDKVVAHMAVEIDAVRIHIGIWRSGIGDAGIERDNALCAKVWLEGFVELAPRACVTGLLGDVDGCFDIPVIGGAGMEGAGVDVAYDLSSPFCDEVGIAFRVAPIRRRNSSSLGTSYSKVMAVFVT